MGVIKKTIIKLKMFNALPILKIDETKIEKKKFRKRFLLLLIWMIYK